MHPWLLAHGGGDWSVRTQARATEALRQVAATDGLPSANYALNSHRIRSATCLSAGVHQLMWSRDKECG